MNPAEITHIILAMAGLAGDILEAAAKRGENPIDAIETLRASLRIGISESAQIELDKRWKRSDPLP